MSKPPLEVQRLATLTPEQRDAYWKRKLGEKSVFRVTKCANNGEWPEKTDEKCHWCMHGFDWMPVGVPTRWDEIRGRIELTGNFCSFACALAKLLSTTCSSDRQVSLLRKLAHDVFGLRAIRSAPPQEVLCQSGASIDEFRARTHEATYEYLPGAFIPRDTYAVEQTLCNTTLPPMLNSLAPKLTPHTTATVTERRPVRRGRIEAVMEAMTSGRRLAVASNPNSS